MMSERKKISDESPDISEVPDTLQQDIPEPLRAAAWEKLSLPLVFLLGWLFVSAVCFSQPGFGILLFTAAFLTAGIAVLRVAGQPVRSESWPVFSCLLIMAVSFFVHGWQSYCGLTLSFMAGMAAYWYALAAGLCRGSMIEDLCEAIVQGPFSRFWIFFRILAAKRPKKEKKQENAANMIFIGIGVLVSFLAAVFVISLLARVDDEFAGLTGCVLAFIQSPFELFADYTVELVLAVPVTLYFTGLFFGAVHRRPASTVSVFAPGCPQVTIAAPLATLTVIYAAFFVEHMVSLAQKLSASGTFVYSAYARQGFFELCVVAALNFFFVAAAHLFCKKDGKLPPLLRGLIFAVAAATLGLAGTAIAKLLMYIRVYGLTARRVTAAWGLATLVVLFLFVVLATGKEKAGLERCCIRVVTVSVLLFCIVGVDELVACYNFARLESGSLTEFELDDYRLLDNPANLPYLADYYQNAADEGQRREIYELVACNSRRWENDKLFDTSVQKIRAARAAETILELGRHERNE